MVERSDGPPDICVTRFLACYITGMTDYSSDAMNLGLLFKIAIDIATILASHAQPPYLPWDKEIDIKSHVGDAFEGQLSAAEITLFCGVFTHTYNSIMSDQRIAIHGVN